MYVRMYVCMYLLYEKQTMVKSDSDIHILMVFNFKPKWDFRDIRYSSLRLLYTTRSRGGHALLAA